MRLIRACAFMRGTPPRYAMPAFLLCATIVGTTPALAARLVASDMELTAAVGSRERGLARADFDGDGRDELVVSVASPSSMLLIANESMDGTWVTHQTLIHPGDWSAQIPVTWRAPGGDRLLVLGNNSEAIEYAGWPLTRIRRFPIVAIPHAGVVGDVNLDGDPELLLAHAGGVTAYGLSDGAPRWTVEGAANDVALGQFDADAAIEIVIAGPPGRVIDGATLGVDWSYSDGFGHFLTTGRFGEPGTNWFVGAYAWSTLIAYRSVPYSPVWDFPVFNTGSLASCDMDGDARDEILVGEAQWGSVLVLDPATRTVRREIPNPDYGIPALVTADFDGDSGCDIVFAPRASGDGALYTVVDAVGDRIRHLQPALFESFSTIAFADLDADGRVEQLTATARDPARLRVHDPDTNALRWAIGASPDNPDDPLRMGTQRLLAAQLDGDPGLEVALVGSTYHGVRIVIIDSASRTVQRRIGNADGTPLRYRAVADAEWVQFIAGAPPELAVLTTSMYGQDPGVRIHVFSMVNGANLWDSVPMAHDGGTPSLQVMQTDADPAPEIVVGVGTEIRAFDSGTRLLDWALPSPSPITALAHDPLRREIYAARGGSIAVYDAFDRNLLRVLPDMIDVTAIRPIGEAVPLLAILDDRTVRLIDALTGQEYGRSDWVGPEAESHPSSWAQHIAFHPAQPRWNLGVTSAVGVFRYSILGPESLFLDGFEDW